MISNLTMQTVPRFGLRTGLAGIYVFSYHLYISLYLYNYIIKFNMKYICIYRFKDWDKPDPHRPAEDVAYAVARFFETNGTVQNYYMVCIYIVYLYLI